MYNTAGPSFGNIIRQIRCVYPAAIVNASNRVIPLPAKPGSPQRAIVKHVPKATESRLCVYIFPAEFTTLARLLTATRVRSDTRPPRTFLPAYDTTYIIPPCWYMYLLRSCHRPYIIHKCVCARGGDIKYHNIIDNIMVISYYYIIILLGILNL
jgi:hypothetical protein